MNQDADRSSSLQATRYRPGLDPSALTALRLPYLCRIGRTRRACEYFPGMGGSPKP